MVLLELWNPWDYCKYKEQDGITGADGYQQNHWDRGSWEPLKLNFPMDCLDNYKNF